MMDNVDTAVALGQLTEKITALGRDMGELKGDVKAILNQCPKCQASIAAHQATIDAYEKRFVATEDQVKTLSSRLWGVGLSAAGSGAIIGIIVSKLWK